MLRGVAPAHAVSVHLVSKHSSFFFIQKWLRNHAPRPSSADATSTTTAAPAPTPAAPAAAASLGRSALGARSSYRERASSASPLRRGWLKQQHGRQKAWVDENREAKGDDERNIGSGNSSGGGVVVGGVVGGGGDGYTRLSWKDERAVSASEGVPEQHRCPLENEEKEEEEMERERQREEGQRRLKVERAFRAWLDRKKKQEQAEREAQQEREEALQNLRY